MRAIGSAPSAVRGSAAALVAAAAPVLALARFAAGGTIFAGHRLWCLCSGSRAKGSGEAGEQQCRQDDSFCHVFFRLSVETRLTRAGQSQTIGGARGADELSGGVGGARPGVVCTPGSKDASPMTKQWPWSERTAGTLENRRSSNFAMKVGSSGFFAVQAQQVWPDFAEWASWGFAFRGWVAWQHER